MLSLTAYLAFVGTSLMLSIAPGPDIVFVLMLSSLHGPKAGLWVVLGLLSGLVLQTLAASLGVAAIVAASPTLFWGIRVVGALYLLYLAWGAFHATPVGEQSDKPAQSGLTLWRRGLIMNVTNPKVQIFFLAFLPQFIPVGTQGVDLALSMVFLGVTFMGATAVVFALIAFFAGSVAQRLRTPRVQMVLNRVAGVVFVCLALATLLTH